MTSERDGETAGHYERLAGRYDANWAYSPAYIAWMTGRIVAHGSIGAKDAVADVGCGTGLYACQLAAVVGQVTGADPSQAMLDQVPVGSGVTPLLASAQDLASGRVRLPGETADVIVMKEAVHHIPADERARTLRGLAGLLRPGGRIVIAMLPTRIGYPLFTAALERFEAGQPDPGDIAGMLADFGLSAQVTYEGYELEIPADRYLAMVRDRYMSLLSEFTGKEIEDGIAEIRERHPGDVLTFTDRFAFIKAIRA
jgi:SAM-dependent methyltransferase